MPAIPRTMVNVRSEPPVRKGDATAAAGTRLVLGRLVLRFTVRTDAAVECRAFETILQCKQSTAPGGTRTPNLLIRSQMLYPIELQALAVDGRTLHDSAGPLKYAAPTQACDTHRRTSRRSDTTGVRVCDLSPFVFRSPIWCGWADDLNPPTGAAVSAHQAEGVFFARFPRPRRE